MLLRRVQKMVVLSLLGLVMKQEQLGPVRRQLASKRGVGAGKKARWQRSRSRGRGRAREEHVQQEQAQLKRPAATSERRTMAAAVEA